MKKVIKIMCILLIGLLLVTNVSNVHAEINNNYDANVKINNEGLDEKVTNSKVADAIGALVYALASAVEDLVGWAFKLLTGDKIFPWADRVIFNAIPFLDINFLNPSDNSLFLSGGLSTMLSDIVHNIYFTILTISIGFLGIVVAIMAIRLAISTIASDKSKYKEAIVNWLFALIMLFTVHFILSFVFYLNEKLVEVASYMITDGIGKTQFDGTNKNFSLRGTIGGIVCEGSETLAEELYDSSRGGNRSTHRPVNDISGLNCNKEELFKAYFDENPYKDIEYSIIQQAIDNKTTVKAIMNGTDADSIGISQDVIEMVSYLQACEKICYDQFACNKSLNYIKVTTYLRQYVYEKKELESDGFFKVSPFIWLANNYNENLLQKAFDYIKEERMLKDAQFSEYKQLYLKFRNFGSFLKKLSNTDYGIIISDSNFIWAKDVIGNMGEFFKELAWQEGWVFKRITFQGAILYAIFLTQSVLLFFAYTKRFFYIVILSIMAPIVVIYDFMKKSVS